MLREEGGAGRLGDGHNQDEGKKTCNRDVRGTSGGSTHPEA